jgi:outer membrane protein TolC
LGVLVQLEPDSFDVGPFDEGFEAPPMLPLDKVVSLAMENRPDVTLLDKAVEAREQKVDLEVAEFIPDLFFATEFGYGFSTSKAPPQHGEITDERGDVTSFQLPSLFDPYNFTRWSFAFGLRLRLDPANQYWKLKEAKAQRSETKALRRAAHEGIALEIEKQWVEVSDFLRKIEVNQRRFKAADRWRTQVAVAFQSGGAELKDFITPLKAYYEARLLLLQAKYDYRVGMSKLAELVGVTDLESIARDLEVSSPPLGQTP